MKFDRCNIIKLCDNIDKVIRNVRQADGYPEGFGVITPAELSNILFYLRDIKRECEGYYYSTDKIVRYLVYRHRYIGKEALPTLTVLKLNKLLFFSHAYCLVDCGKRLIPDAFIMGVHGPYIKDVINLFNVKKNVAVPFSFAEESCLDPYVEKVIDIILNSYGRLSDQQLEWVMGHDGFIQKVRNRYGLEPWESSLYAVITDDDVLSHYKFKNMDKRVGKL